MMALALLNLSGSRMVSAVGNVLVYCSDPITVCEDAITVKNDVSGDQSWIIGGGAYKAADKVVQHNGCGTVNIIVSLPPSLQIICATSCKSPRYFPLADIRHRTSM